MYVIKPTMVGGRAVSGAVRPVLAPAGRIPQTPLPGRFRVPVSKRLMGLEGNVIEEMPPDLPSSADTYTQTMLSINPFSNPLASNLLPGKPTVFTQAYGWMQNNQGVVWIAAIGAVGLMLLRKRRG